jgi:hypothetical protein
VTSVWRPLPVASGWRQLLLLLLLLTAWQLPLLLTAWLLLLLLTAWLLLLLLTAQLLPLLPELLLPDLAGAIAVQLFFGMKTRL